MRHDSPGQRIPSLFAQPRERMERPAAFERADALEVLALEEEVDFRVCGRLALEGGAEEGFRGLRSGCKGGEGRACEDGG